jgi:GNAT superfamily N-acetyltransferase
MTRRPALAPDDVDALVKLYDAYDSVEFGGPEIDATDVNAMLAVDTGENLVVEENGRLLGFADAGSNGEVETVVDPGHPSAEQLQRELLAWVLERSRVFGVRRVEHWAGSRADGAALLLKDAGFAPARTLWRMRRELTGPLPAPAWPRSVEPRTLDRHRDGHAVWELVMRGFAGTFGSHQRPFDEWSLFALAEGRSAILAVEGDALVGVATTGPRSGEGHVGQLTVDPEHRGRGIALALLHEAFRRDRAAGYAATALTVDGENESARRLYEMAGMTVVAEFRRWERDV